MKGKTHQLLPSSLQRLLPHTLALLLVLLAAAPTRAVQNRSVEITGVVTALPNTQGFLGAWTVNGRTIHVAAATRIEQERGQPVIGAIVEVKGALQNDGSINATEIEVKLTPPRIGIPVKFEGAIETLPSTPGRIGDWKVGGKTIHVTSLTRLNQERGQAAVGAMVAVEGLQQTDGSLNALLIQVKGADNNSAVKFAGTVEKLPSTAGRLGDWTISGRLVHVLPTTRILPERAEVAVGSKVEVEGLKQPDNSVNAVKIQVQPANNGGGLNIVNFRGTIETLPTNTTFIGDWKISGRTVIVVERTHIRKEDGAEIKVGARVEVVGTRTGDGPVTAALILVKDDDDQPNAVRFFGEVKTLPAQGLVGDWKVGDKTLHVTANTRINTERGQVAVGALVEVRGAQRQDGSIDATQIEVKQPNGGSAGFVRFLGQVNALPNTETKVGVWTISGRTVHVAATTKLNQEKGRAIVGAFVEVVGNLRTDGAIDAVEIAVKALNGNLFINFYGKIDKLPDNKIGDWLVNNRTVKVTAQTRLNEERARAAVGALVEVKGTLNQDGSINATMIEVKSSTDTGNTPRSFVEFTGAVVTLPSTPNLVGEWKVGDKTVRVNAATRINRAGGQIVVGANVKVRGAQQANGAVDAIHIELVRSVTTADFVTYAGLASVNAGSYDDEITPDSIIASFGAGLALTTEKARSLPLPTTLANVSVLVDGKPAGLFFVSANQINYLAPAGLLPGAAQVVVLLNGQVVAQGALQIAEVAPAVFTANASGRGAPAGSLLRVRANGQQVYEPLARFDAATNQFIAAPIVRVQGEALFLVLFGSGLRTALDTDGKASNGVAENVEITVGGVRAQVLYAGAAPGFAGLDQINLQLPANVAAGANVTLLVKITDSNGNVLGANAVTIALQ